MRPVPTAAGSLAGREARAFAGSSGDVSGAVFVEAPAKVNLVLRVGARRADGYHNVDTLFAAVGLRDRLWVERTAGGITVEATGADLGDPRDNLVYKAARAYLAARGGRGGVAIRLEKRIPIGGGLGGGSSDAAGTLRCLDELFARPAGLPALVEVAGSLGSDVPFFLSSSPLALGSGRGDRLTPLPVLPSLPVLLVGSSQGVGTAWAYNLLARGREEGGAGGPDPAATAPHGGPLLGLGDDRHLGAQRLRSARLRRPPRPLRSDAIPARKHASPGAHVGQWQHSLRRVPEPRSGGARPASS